MASHGGHSPVLASRRPHPAGFLPGPARLGALLSETPGENGVVVSERMSALAPPLIRGVYVPPAISQGQPAGNRPRAALEDFERIVDEYQRRLYGFALRMTGNREDAEEIVQDAFVRAYRALGKMSEQQREGLRLQPWLYTITLNVTRNRLRGKRPPNVALDALADPDVLLRESHAGPVQPEAIVEQNTEIALVERALLQLPMHLRAAATLRFIEGRSHPEIADILHQPIGTVKSHVHRAVRILRRILGPQIGRLSPEGAPLHALS
jgi:RNA polymerase sigma-70 factor (ECF subfamily)